MISISRGDNQQLVKVLKFQMRSLTRVPSNNNMKKQNERVVSELRNPSYAPRMKQRTLTKEKEKEKGYLISPVLKYAQQILVRAASVLPLATLYRKKKKKNYVLPIPSRLAKKSHSHKTSPSVSALCCTISSQALIPYMPQLSFHVTRHAHKNTVKCPPVLDANCYNASLNENKSCLTDGTKIGGSNDGQSFDGRDSITLEADLLAALNTQINSELQAGYGYLYLASWCAHHHVSLLGCTRYFMKEAKEETVHANVIRRYVLERCGLIEMQNIIFPIPPKLTSVQDCFTFALDMEQSITRKLQAIVELADSKRDHRTVDFIVAGLLDHQFKHIYELKIFLNEINRCNGEGLGITIFDRMLMTYENSKHS